MAHHPIMVITDIRMKCNRFLLNNHQQVTSKKFQHQQIIIIIIERIHRPVKSWRKRSKARRSVKIRMNLKSNEQFLRKVIVDLWSDLFIRPVSPYALFFRDTQNDIKKKLINPSFGLAIQTSSHTFHWIISFEILEKFQRSSLTCGKILNQNWKR